MVTTNLNVVKRLLTEIFLSIGREEWHKVVDHVIKCEEEFFTSEEAIDNRLDQFIINTNDDSSASSSSDSASSDSDSSTNIDDQNSDTEIGVRPFE